LFFHRPRSWWRSIPSSRTAALYDRKFAKHHAVDHSRNEYAYKLDGVTVMVNGPENYFSIFKRGIYGVYHSVSEAHMHRYLSEFDFRYNNRSKLGVEDAERAIKAIKGAEGKRLTYHQPANQARAGTYGLDAS